MLCLAILVGVLAFAGCKQKNNDETTVPPNTDAAIDNIARGYHAVRAARSAGTARKTRAADTAHKTGKQKARCNNPKTRTGR